MAQTWGYKPNDKIQKGNALIRMLVNVVCRGGNLLLNVGPDPQGAIPQAVKESLMELGDWMKENGESIYETRAGFWQPQDDVFGCTTKDDCVYVHVLDCKAFETLVFSNREIPAGKKLVCAQLLSGVSVEIERVENNCIEEGFALRIPEQTVQEKRVDTIIKLSFQEE